LLYGVFCGRIRQMKSNSVIRKIAAVLLVVLLLLPFTGCGAPDPGALKAAYQAAIDDARIAAPEEISRDLEPIAFYNQDLVWDGGRVLLLTWTSWNGYSGSVGGNMTLSREVWVVVPHELKDFYGQNRSLQGDNLILRLEQLYGLPPDNGKQYFVEFWVDPADVFRPSPDPDTADREAELDFPAWVDTAYRDWFNNLLNTSYRENGYPWTRLGYTYDWGNSKSEVGLSEFVIRAGSAVGINAVSGSLEYFSKN
jgi:hypothetical protein